MKTLTLEQAPVILEVTESSEITIVHVAKQSLNLKKDLYCIISKPDIYVRITLKILAYANSHTECNIVGKIEPSAKGTDLYISVKALIIDSSAVVNITPSLEIQQSELRAGHGATIGYIDPHQKWYLESRGFNESESEKVLIDAFLAI